MLSDPRKKWSGFGMTLRLPNTPISDMWYSHLETPDGRWKPLWGADGTGTIYSGKVEACFCFEQCFCVFCSICVFG